MSTLLTLSYLAHVLAGGLWTGATLYVAATVLSRDGPAAISVEGFVGHAHRLLLITRWTGLVLPVTGLYQLWRLYPLDALLSTTNGWLVLAMFALWGLMNTAIEAGGYAMRRQVAPTGLGGYMAAGFPPDTIGPETSTAELAAIFRPYLLASAVMAVGLLATAALLAVPG